MFKLRLGWLVLPDLFLMPASWWKCADGSDSIFPPTLPLFLHQSIFMFPLSFSSSSSLSSTPPALDLISEFDHGLSDISEDDDLVVNPPASHTQLTPPSDTPSSFSDQLLADLEHLLKTSLTSQALTGSQTNGSEVVGVEEGCQAKTRATVELQSCFSLRALLKCLSLFLCFLSLLGKNCSNRVTTKVQAGVRKLSAFTAALSKLTSAHRSGGHLMIRMDRSPNTPCFFHRILNYVVLQLANLMAFFTTHVPLKCSRSVPAGLGNQSRLNWTCPLLVSSLSSLPTKVFSGTLSSSLLPFCPLSTSTSCLPAPILRYLRNPSPLFLPCLLILFLLAVMLTASQSLALALILATPLGLTLCYLENAVSSQRRAAVLPKFVSQTANDRQDNQLSSGFSLKASAQNLKHSSPHVRHQVHKSTNWTQEMCDPAAWPHEARCLTPHPPLTFLLFTVNTPQPVSAPAFPAPLLHLFRMQEKGNNSVCVQLKQDLTAVNIEV